MLRYSCCALLMAALTLASSHAGPLRGPFRKTDIRLGYAEKDTAEFDFTAVFTGGQRACIFVRGDHDPIVPLEISVYAKDGERVAHDISERDFLSVFWVPPRTAEYRIVLKNHGPHSAYEKFDVEEKKYTELYLSLK